MELYLKLNTKKCPKCGTGYAKQRGCMHMTCYKEYGGCGHDWCWVCFGDFKTHEAD